MTHLCSLQFACEQGLRVQGEDGYEASRGKWGGWGRVRGSAGDEEAETAQHGEAVQHEPSSDHMAKGQTPLAQDAGYLYLLMDLQARSLRSVPKYSSWHLCVAQSLPCRGAYRGPH